VQFILYVSDCLFLQAYEFLCLLLFRTIFIISDTGTSFSGDTGISAFK